MRCFRCNRELAERQTEAGPIRPCFGCGAVWFPGATLAARVPALRQLAGASCDLACPDCGSGLCSASYRAMQLDFCPSCNGVFFDRGEFAFATADPKAEAAEFRAIAEFFALL